MKRLFTQTAVAAATVVCLGTAQAAVIDFESVDTSGAPFAPLLNNFAFVTQGGFLVQTYDGAGSPNPVALTGSLIGPTSGGACDASTLTCPAGSGDYLALLDNGVAYIQALNNDPLVLHSFDAAFIAPATGVPSTAFGLLVVEADRADATFAIGAFALKGPGTSGSTSFASFLADNATYGLFSNSTGTLTSGNIVDYQFLEYYCSSSSLSSCSYARTDLSQFALDNVSITAVPEPSGWALMTLGMAGLAAAARRRRAA